MRADIDEHPDEDEKAEKDEKFRVEFHHAAPLERLTELTAAATAAGSAGVPPRRSTIAPAASRAISATLVIAWARVAAICALGLGQLGGEFVLQRLSLGLRVGRGGVARGLGQALRLGARLGQRLFVRGRGRVGLLLHRRRVVEVARDLGLAALDHRAELRQARAST